jgi:hypothetical protein
MAPWNRFHVREYRASELAELLRSRFPRVQVLGMFGAPALYRTEIDRVDAARRRVRRAEREAGVLAVSAPERQRTPFVRMARRLLPAGARSWLRSMARGKRPLPGPRTASGASAAVAPPSGQVEEPIDLSTFLKFSTDDLWYADTDVDTSMDLMAVCRLE